MIRGGKPIDFSSTLIFSVKYIFRQLPTINNEYQDIYNIIVGNVLVDRNSFHNWRVTDGAKVRINQKIAFKSNFLNYNNCNGELFTITLKSIGNRQTITVLALSVQNGNATLDWQCLGN